MDIFCASSLSVLVLWGLPRIDTSAESDGPEANGLLSCTLKLAQLQPYRLQSINLENLVEFERRIHLYTST